MEHAITWVLLGIAGGFGLCAVVVLACLPIWIRNAEVGVDPFADLGAFDDDEAAALLDTDA